MKKTLGRRFGAGLAGLAMAGAGFAAFGATGVAHAAPGDVTVGELEFDPELVYEGDTLTTTFPFYIEGETTDDVTVELVNLTNFDCESTSESFPAGTEGDGSFDEPDATVDFDCTPETYGERSQAEFRITYGDEVLLDGPEAYFYIDSEADPDPEPTDTDSPDPDPTESESPSESAAPAPEISIASGTFDPPSAVVEEGGEFEFTKAVTISDAPLTGDLTMELSDFTNLDCEPTEDSIEAGSEPGTYEFVFNCEFGAGNEAASGSYTISGDDLPEDVTGTFGYGDIDDDGNNGDGNNDNNGDSDNGSSDEDSDSEGGLADTGAPAVGVVLAGGLAAAAAGGLLLRRRK